MKRLLLPAITAAMVAAVATTASADTYLGSYVARIGENDHYASDGYLLDTAAQMVRQDRANWHKFGVPDAEDENDSWFGDTESRAWLEKALNRKSAMNQATRKAIVNGYPLVQVDVYQNSVKVSIIGY